MLSRNVYRRHCIIQRTILYFPTMIQIQSYIAKILHSTVSSFYITSRVPNYTSFIFLGLRYSDKRFQDSDIFRHKCMRPFFYFFGGKIKKLWNNFGGKIKKLSNVSATSRYVLPCHTVYDCVPLLESFTSFKIVMICF